MSRNLIRPVFRHCQAVSLFAAKVADPMDPTVKLGDSDYFKHQQLVQSLGSSSAPICSLLLPASSYRALTMLPDLSPLCDCFVGAPLRLATTHLCSNNGQHLAWQPGMGYTAPHIGIGQAGVRCCELSHYVLPRDSFLKLHLYTLSEVSRSIDAVSRYAFCTRRCAFMWMAAD